MVNIFHTCITAARSTVTRTTLLWALTSAASRRSLTLCWLRAYADFRLKGRSPFNRGTPLTGAACKATAIERAPEFRFRCSLLFAKNDPAKLGCFCRAESASFDALRGVIGYLGAEIPVGDFMGVVRTLTPAEDSPPTGGCPVGAVCGAYRVFYAANCVRG